MAKKTNSAPSGWLILDKPAGITSAQAVGRVKRLLNPKKIGHGGTLDPMATGILPLALNEATKAFQFVVANTKAYEFTVQWGCETTTDDAEGEVSRSSEILPTLEEINAKLPDFLGNIMQAPPAFSAIKVDGKRAYSLARKGENVVLAERSIRVDSLRIIATPNAQHTQFEMICGKGTYVRSVARDLGRALGCFGHVTTLRRTMVGKFNESSAISLEKLEELVHSARLNERLLPVSSVLADIPALELDPEAARRIKNGQPMSSPSHFDEGAMVQLISQRCLIAVTQVTNGQLKPVRVFNLEDSM
ncbi:MAG: tRNA pseudouridine(55) synthase TruB [Alphaproteobacteria bacterium]|nr:tRNA pseudouridine(55) synthase TruB [Alphaproteobacteria bacterium]